MPQSTFQEWVFRLGRYLKCYFDIEQTTITTYLARKILKSNNNR